jgi:hypothetical protein
VLSGLHFSFSCFHSYWLPLNTGGVRAFSTKPPDEVEFEAG